MRQFKFRVWDIARKKYMLPGEDTKDSFAIWADGDMVAYDFWANGKHHNDDLSIPSEAIIQQYIGLKDKSDKEIYEGDFVKYTEKMNEHGDVQLLIAQVFYYDAYACFALGGNNSFWNLFTDYGIGDIEVIGNIFENPELLK